MMSLHLQNIIEKRTKQTKLMVDNVVKLKHILMHVGMLVKTR